MEYARSYQYIFETPNWWKNVLFLVVAMLVPIAGPLVILGYQGEIALRQLREGDGPCPDFDMDRLGAYLKRGVWPFVAGLLVGVGVAIVAMIPLFLIGLLAGATGSEGVATLGLAFFMFAWFVFIFLVNLVVLPILLRTLLEGALFSAFSVSYLKSFVANVWLEMILAWLFLSVTAIGLALAGMLVCLVGVYLTTPLVFFAQAHLYAQLVRLHHERGGEAIPLNDTVSL